MTHAYGSQTRHYFTNQTAISVAKNPSGSDSIKMAEALSFTKTQNAEPDSEFHALSRSPVGENVLDKMTEFSLTAYCNGAGTQGNAPDIDNLLKTAFTQSAKSATTIASDLTTTTMKLTADNLDAGDIGAVIDDNGYIHHFYVESKDGLDVLTFTPAISDLTIGNVVSGVRNYKPELFGTSDFVTLYKSDNLYGEMGVGAKGKSFSWALEYGQPLKCAISGECRDMHRAIVTTLAEALDDSETDVDVTDPGIEVGAVILCESEAMLVTAIDSAGTTLTVIRGYDSTVAAAHIISTTIGPPQPAESTTGSAALVACGGLWIENLSGVETQLKLESGSIEINENTNFLRSISDCGSPEEVANPQDREINLSFTVYLREASIETISQIVENNQLSVVVQVGRVSGAAWGFYFKNVIFDIAEITSTAGEVIKATLNSRRVLADSGDNAFVIGN